MSAKKKSQNAESKNKNPVQSDAGNYDETEYKLKMSEHSNYLKFLKMTDEAVASDDEYPQNGDVEGFIEDDIIGDMLPSECDMHADESDLTEADENMYPDLNSPPFETVPTDNGANEPTKAMTEEEKQKQMEECQEELARVEGEIATLRQVLGAKVRLASELKRKMGITPFQELKQDIQIGIKSIQSSGAYQKTNEKLHDINDKITHSNAYQKTSSAMKTASEKTNAVVSSAASAVGRKLGDIRSSDTFKSMEERVGGAYASVKAKVTGSKSESESFEDALKKETEEKETVGNGTQNLPEEKVPL